MKDTHIKLVIIIIAAVLALPAAFGMVGKVGAVKAIGITVADARGTIAGKPQCGTWSIVPTPTKTQSLFKGVAAVSLNDAWAVGFLGTSYQPTGTLIEHWNGTQWSIVQSPNPSPGSGYELNAVTALATNDVWAVGAYQNHGYKTLMEHWNGTQWSVIPSPGTPGQPILTGVTAISKNDVWAVGYDSEPLIEHWNGTQWSIVPSPGITGGAGLLYSVSAVSSTDVWAVGVFITDPGFNKLTLLFHWNGNKWKRVSIPVNYDSSLGGVAAISTTNVWAVGFLNGGTLSERWNGNSWQPVSSPGGGFLNAVTPVAGTHLLWAVGADQVNGYTLTELRDGGKWTIVPTSNTGFLSSTFNGVAASDASHVWAVGSYETSSYETYALIEFYC
jgi:hypothetical protein